MDTTFSHVADPVHAEVIIQFFVRNCLSEVQWLFMRPIKHPMLWWIRSESTGNFVWHDIRISNSMTSPASPRNKDRIAAKSHRTRTRLVRRATTRKCHQRPAVIDLHLLYVDRTNSIYQLVQRRLLADPDHDQTIRRNPSVLHP